MSHLAPALAKADSRLMQQIDRAARRNEFLQAWFLLDPQAVEQRRGVDALAHEIVDRVKDRVGHGWGSMSVQDNLGTFVVFAKPDFLRGMLDEPEITMARPTELSGFGLIKPVERHPVKLRRRFLSKTMGSKKK